MVLKNLILGLISENIYFISSKWESDIVVDKMKQHSNYWKSENEFHIFYVINARN